MASVIINYCSNEKIFIDAILTECLKFSNDIVVSYGSHLYDGKKEDIDHINEYKNKYKDIQFVEYQVDITLDVSKKKGVINRPTAYWHNLARWTGIQSVKNKEWVFIIDSDEIPDGYKVKDFLHLNPIDETECYKFANYWYFKYPENQATTIEDSVLLMHYKYITEDNIFKDFERDDLINYSGTKLNRQIMYFDYKPMWHHYSGVRTKEGLRHKLKHWGHCNEYLNTDALIYYVYKDDKVNDIIHGYQYIKVDNLFNINL